jgi:ABC-type taurine transport system substrate-binding protein
VELDPLRDARHGPTGAGDLGRLTRPLVKGTIDAAITDEPATTLAIKTGAKVLSARPYQTITKEPVFSCWLAKTTWVDSHKLAAREFVAALEEADSYIAKHPHYLRSILPKYAKLPAAIANVITMPIITTQITAAILTKWEKVALRFGMLKHDVKVKSLIAHLGS